MYPRSHGECKQPTEDRGLEQPSVSGPGTQLATQSPAATAGAAAEDRGEWGPTGACLRTPSAPAVVTRSLRDLDSL